MNEHELMAEMKVSKAVAKMAVPSVVSSLVTVIYNMADTFFVGQTGDALQVAAVSLTNPIFILLMAFANMLGMGGSAVASVALGKKKEKRVKNVTSFVFFASLAVGVVFMILLLVFMRPILTLFGANAETYAFARGYTLHISYGAPFIIWSAASSFILRVEGASKEAMIGNMIGTIANIVLDPIFISGLGMGAAGAAIATTIGNVLACLYYLWYFLKKTKIFSISPRYFTCGEEILVKVCTIGLPTAIFSGLMSISTIILNQILVVYGNAPVAAIGIVFKANMFITFLQMGLANGVQPLLGYNYGAENMQRFQAVERYKNMLHCRGHCLGYPVLCMQRADHPYIHQRQRRGRLWRADAHRLHAVRPGHRHPVHEHELHAVGGTCLPGNRALRAAPGHPADPASVPPGRAVWAEWRDLWTEHH